MKLSEAKIIVGKAKNANKKAYKLWFRYQNEQTNANKGSSDYAEGYACALINLKNQLLRNLYKSF